MRYFYDTEFIENGSTIDLVSIGIVAEDGREYYAVSTDADHTKANKWVREHVLDKLPNPSSPLWRSREQIRTEVYEFLTASPGRPANSQYCRSSRVYLGISDGSELMSPHSCANTTWS